jgi:hypothetical protein
MVGTQISRSSSCKACIGMPNMPYGTSEGWAILNKHVNLGTAGAIVCHQDFMVNPALPGKRTQHR